MYFLEKKHENHKAILRGHVGPNRFLSQSKVFNKNFIFLNPTLVNPQIKQSIMQFVGIKEFVDEHYGTRFWSLWYFTKAQGTLLDLHGDPNRPS